MQEESLLKLPPQSIEAEQSVLGSLMLDSKRFDDISDVLFSSDFYTHAHKIIFETIQRLEEVGAPVDIVTVQEQLVREGRLEIIGGLAYLDKLIRNTPSTFNIKSYAEIIRERSIFRQLVEAANSIAEISYNPKKKSATEILDFAEQTIFKIAQQRESNTEYKSVHELMKSTVDKIDQLIQNQGALSGLDTGYPDLNKLTSGLQKSDLIVLAGRPAMGKTSFAMNLVENVVREQDSAVLFFSLEMPAEQLNMRLLSSLSRVNLLSMREGKLSDDDFSRIMSSANILRNLPIYIDDSAGITPLEIRSRCRRLQKQLSQEGKELGLVVIDYLQLMSSSSAAENRVNEISAMTRSLKLLAKELDIPVIVLSQLSRGPEQRTDKRPMASDLRESGSIEQDADMIIFVYRDEVYNKESQQKGTAEIIISKQRNGPIGTVRLTFLGEYTRFENYAGVDSLDGY